MSGPSRERLLELFYYDKDTGLFTRRIATAKRSKVGEVAGGIQYFGHVSIRIDGRRWLAHRLAWLYVHGVWPNSDIDHVNGNPGDNRIVNLRLATVSQNLANARRRKDNSSGYKGVTFHRQSGKWRAVVCVGGKSISLGLHATAKEASDAYAKGAVAQFGEYARVS